ncbi:hypothetical protein EB118_15125 [bacterium]|nr:hypothetical protein [bacterium]NDD82666.1 hypothetical protein [bacterium]NDG31387.1 hypothetical protein [bacterium]
MRFVIWFLKTTVVHVLILLLMIAIALSWEAALDKTVAIWMTSITLIVLIGGKLYYYYKNVK